ncbi:uncharacterized protein CCOS01_15399 [Colletotrichum costaricense]|uniref:Uncharacterized protein n=1 Tax=Colletotrichum costaricense TaxID=1209916 RepID=A0AAI9YI36_9PEZI|nr:uncharacterized protein CCOS01_15399 [Colletotrichum costaricense]KAK1510568.1 hypothetical protein CCOS01_15399 [Colletotrichum costaricense]
MASTYNQPFRLMPLTHILESPTSRRERLSGSETSTTTVQLKESVIDSLQAGLTFGGVPVPVSTGNHLT